MITPNLPQIHVAYADYYAIVRSSISTCVNASGHFIVDIQANNGEELIQQLKRTQILPDICILDINMPVKNGYETIKEAKKLWPSMKFLVLTTINKEYTILQMIKNGASGYLLKSCDPDELNKALISIYKTGYYLTELTSSQILSFLHEKDDSTISKLNSKELQFLSLSASDYTYREIAQKMHVSPRTIDGYRDALFNKLNIKSRTGLAIFAISIGLFSFH